MNNISSGQLIAETALKLLICLKKTEKWQFFNVIFTQWQKSANFIDLTTDKYRFYWPNDRKLSNFYFFFFT